MYECYTEKQLVVLLDVDCSTSLRDVYLLPFYP